MLEGGNGKRNRIINGKPSLITCNCGETLDDMEFTADFISGDSGFSTIQLLIKDFCFAEFSMFA